MIMYLKVMMFRSKLKITDDCKTWVSSSMIRCLTVAYSDNPLSPNNSSRKGKYNLVFSRLGNYIHLSMPLKKGLLRNPALGND